MSIDLASVTLDQVALLNQRSGFILMGAAQGSREQAQEWDSWLEQYRQNTDAVDAALRSHRILDHAQVRVLLETASWWELADGPMRFASTFGSMAGYLIPRGGDPMPDITSYVAPGPDGGSMAAFAAATNGVLNRPDKQVGALRALREQAETARANGDLEEAGTRMRAAFEILGDPEGPSVRDNWREAAELVLAAQRLGDSLLEADQPDAALRWWTMALMVIGPLAPESPPAEDLNRSIGRLHRNRGDLNRALPCFERALAASTRRADAARKEGSPDVKSLTGLAVTDVGSVAEILCERGDLDEAHELAGQAIQLAESAGVGGAATGRLLLTAGEIDRRRGALQSARHLYERGSAIAEADDPFSELAITLMIKLGEVEHACGDSPAAMQRLERALALAQTTDPNSLPTAAALMAISQIHVDRHAPEQALAYYRRAEGIVKMHAPADYAPTSGPSEPPGAAR
jgi:tetratricopeptide (TPR) repeat protein